MSRYVALLLPLMLCCGCFRDAERTEPSPLVAHRLAKGTSVTLEVARSSGNTVEVKRWIPAGWYIVPARLVDYPLPLDGAGGD